jgi:hypothetical protein
VRELLCAVKVTASHPERKAENFARRAVYATIVASFANIAAAMAPGLASQM